MGAHGIALGNDRRELETTRRQTEQDQPGEQGESAGSSQQQRLKSRPTGLGRGVIEADEQVGNDCRQLPEHKERDQIIGEH